MRWTAKSRRGSARSALSSILIGVPFTNGPRLTDQSTFRTPGPDRTPVFPPLRGPWTWENTSGSPPSGFWQAIHSCTLVEARFRQIFEFPIASQNVIRPRPLPRFRCGPATVSSELQVLRDFGRLGTGALDCSNDSRWRLGFLAAQSNANRRPPSRRRLAPSSRWRNAEA